MWLVAKYKTKEFQTFKDNLTKKLGNKPTFFIPKIKYQKHYKNKLKTFEKYILENYLLCYHPKFSSISFVNSLKYIKGLKYFLSGYQKTQREIQTFIKKCKDLENDKGYLSQSFFYSFK